MNKPSYPTTDDGRMSIAGWYRRPSCKVSVRMTSHYHLRGQSPKLLLMKWGEIPNVRT
jgi:hypothetical protein